MKLTKEQEQCPYCHYDADGVPVKCLKNNEKCRVSITNESNLCIKVLKGYSACDYCIAINYCPKCGRILRKKPIIDNPEFCFECCGAVTKNSGDLSLSMFFDDRKNNNFILCRYDDRYRFRYNLLFEFCPFCARPLNTPVPSPWE